MLLLKRTRVHDPRRWIEIRFGNQGSAQAQNLRDSGIPNEKIVVANREDSYVASAKDKGFNVEHDFGKAAEVADGNHFTPKSARVLLIVLFSDIPLGSRSGPTSGVQRASGPKTEGYSLHCHR